jgi:hypothetical protein
VAGTRSASTFSQSHPFDANKAFVAAAEYASYDRASSELSGPTSDISCPSRGCASVAASDRQEPAMAVMARLPGCHVWYGKKHFLLDCPLLSTEVKIRIEVQRAQQIQQNRGGCTAGGSETPLRSLRSAFHKRCVVTAFRAVSVVSLAKGKMGNGGYLDR